MPRMMIESGRDDREAPTRRGRGSRLLIAVAVLLFLAAHPVRADEAPIAFQPGFHQAMRNWTWRSPTTTFRIKLPIGRSGNRVRVSFKSGDGPLEIRSATIGLAGSNGALASTPVRLFFRGSPGAMLSRWERVTSDPASFTASFGSDVYVSFEFEGAAAATTINAFPDGYEWQGSFASEMHPPPGRPLMKVAGVNTVDVEAVSARALVAIGDSITEGYIMSDLGEYVAYNDDTRNAWPSVAQGILRLPFVNAAVSAQGLDDATAYLSADVLVLQGVTDCVVLLGTNDLGSKPVEEMQSLLAALFDRLRSFCRVWGGTLLPREADPPAIAAKRHAVNEWLRHRAAVADVIDFEGALTSPTDPDHFRSGLVNDGIHPTIEGQHQMGIEAARIVASPTLTSIAPQTASADTGAVVTFSGTGFKAGASISFGSLPASAVQVISASQLRATAPAASPGKVDVQVRNPDGLSFTLRQGFEYQASQTPPAADPPPPSEGRPSASPHGCSSTGMLPDPVIVSVLVLAFFRVAANGWSSRRKAFSAAPRRRA